MTIKNIYNIIKTAKTQGSSNEALNIMYANLIFKLRNATRVQLVDFLKDDTVYNTILCLVKDMKYTEAQIEDIIVCCYTLNLMGGGVRNK